ncbi:MAG: hypothetical protein AAFN91_03290 [Pseudomonadota bacterium]
MTTRSYLLATIIACVLLLVFATQIMTSRIISHERDCGLPPNEAGYASAVAYWVPWDTMTLFRYSKTDVVDLAREVKDFDGSIDVNCLAVLLSGIELSHTRFDPGRMDGRLVVKVIRENGEQGTYFADRFSVCLLEEQKCGEITEEFRSDITALLAPSAA